LEVQQRPRRELTREQQADAAGGDVQGASWPALSRGRLGRVANRFDIAGKAHPATIVRRPRPDALGLEETERRVTELAREGAAEGPPFALLGASVDHAGLEGSSRAAGGALQHDIQEGAELDGVSEGEADAEGGDIAGLRLPESAAGGEATGRDQSGGQTD